MGRNKLETKHEVTFAAEQRGSIDAGKPDDEGRGNYLVREDSPQKSVRFGQNSHASIGGSFNSGELASLSVGSLPGEDEEGR